ncbi:hypothetical protein O1L44_24830 [Streptomyces noursei]|nr:hypothetical protein [Streptomyces noursei]
MSEALLSHAVAAAKRARRTAGRVRRRVEQINTVPVLGARARPRPALRPAHLSVLVGRTLNLAVPWPPGAAAVTEARLVLERRGRWQSIPWNGNRSRTAGSCSPPPRRCATHGTTTPPPRPRLDDGIWRLTVAAIGADGQETRYGIAAPDVPASDGPTLPSRPARPAVPPSDPCGPSTATPCSR